LLEAPEADWNHPAYTATIHRGVIGRSVRTDRWRYTEWGDGLAAELYDHNADPGEYRNLAANPTLAAEIVTLKKLLAAPPRVAKIPRTPRPSAKARRRARPPPIPDPAL